MHLLSVSNKDYKLMHYSIFFKNQNLGQGTNFILCLLKISTDSASTTKVEYTLLSELDGFIT